MKIKYYIPVTIVLFLSISGTFLPSSSGIPKEFLSLTDNGTKISLCRTALSSPLSETDAGLLHFALGKALFSSGSTPEAMAEFSDPTIMKTPLWEHALFLQAQVYEANNQMDQAIERYNYLFELKNAPSFKRESAAALVRLNIQKNNFVEPIPFLKFLREIEPKEPYWASVLSTCLLNGEHFEDAKRNALDVLILNPKGEYEKKILAQNEFKSILSMLTEDEIISRLQTLINSERWKLFPSAGSGFYPEKPSNRAALEVLSARYLIKNHSKHFIRSHLEKAMILDPLNSEALYLLCDIAGQQKDIGALQSQIEIAKALPDTNQYKVKIFSKILNYRKREMTSDEAIAICESILKIDKNNESAMEYIWNEAFALKGMGNEEGFVARLKLLYTLLANTQDFKNSSAYWIAKTLFNKGQNCNEYFDYLERYDRYGYYGYMVRNLRDKINPPPPQPNISTVIPNSPYFEKGDALANLGLIDEARREYALEKDSSLQKWVYAKISEAEEKVGNTRSAISYARRAFPEAYTADGSSLPLSIWKRLYPVSFTESISRQSTEEGIDPIVISGIIRQESIWDPLATSKSGARGLMQIIPSTGIILAKKCGVGRINPSSLYDPELNIRLGISYFSDLLKRFDNKVEYALAAYNAGPNRIPRWIDGCKCSLDEWVERIPFKETRGYVKRIKVNIWEYKRIYGDLKEEPTNG